MDWLIQHTDLISSFANLVVVGIWTFYTFVFFRDFRSRHRPRILIHQAPANSADAQCLIINMSQSIMDVACVLIVGHIGKRTIWRQLDGYHQRDAEPTSFNASSSAQSPADQGPLQPGQFLALCPFDQMLDSLEKEFSHHGALDALEVRVVAYFGTKDSPVAAYRRFTIESHGDESCQTRVRAQSLHTHHLVRFWQIGKPRRWMEQCIKR